MQPSCSTRFPSQIDRLLLKQLPPKKLSRLRAHLSGCPECQHRYNKVILASRLLEGGPEALTVPSEGELFRVREEVMRRVRLVPDAQPVRRSTATWVAAVATCGVVLAIGLPLVLRESVSRPPAVEEHAAIAPGSGGVEEHTAQEFHPRGPQGQPGAPQLGLRAFCLRKVAGQSVVTGLAPASQPAAPAGSCSVTEVLKLAYTNRSELRHLFLVGVDERYQIKWYEPHPPEQQSIKVRGDAVDEPLQRAVRLAVNHRPGELRIFALFSERPLTAADIEQAVARARKSRTPLARLAELGVPGARQQQSLLLRLQP